MDRRVVELFLQRLNDKLKIFGVAFRPREKNTVALTELDITPAQRLEYIRKLVTEDYYSGPHKDTHDPARPDYFEFGIQIRKKEVYIKLSQGLPGKMVDCMSFHEAERPMSYPLKKTEE